MIIFDIIVLSHHLQGKVVLLCAQNNLAIMSVIKRSIPLMIDEAISSLEVSDLRVILMIDSPIAISLQLPPASVQFSVVRFITICWISRAS